MKNVLVVLFILTGCTENQNNLTVEMAAEKIVTRKERCAEITKLLSLQSYEIVNDQGNIYCFVHNQKRKDKVPGYIFGDQALSEILRYNEILAEIK